MFSLSLPPLPLCLFNPSNVHILVNCFRVNGARVYVYLYLRVIFLYYFVPSFRVSFNQCTLPFYSFELTFILNSQNMETHSAITIFHLHFILSSNVPIDIFQSSSNVLYPLPHHQPLGRPKLKVNSSD